MLLVIDGGGVVTCLYEESIDLSALGPLAIRRASHVEPDAAGRWWADLGPVAGPRLGPFRRRSEARGAERLWLEANWLGHTDEAVPEYLEGGAPTETNNL